MPYKMNIKNIKFQKNAINLANFCLCLASIVFLISACSQSGKVKILKGVSKEAQMVVKIKIIEAHLEGLFPIKKQGLNIKKEYGIENDTNILNSRINTRKYLNLKASCVEIFKGTFEKELTFNIDLSELLDSNNLPNLFIGGNYIVYLRNGVDGYEVISKRILCKGKDDIHFLCIYPDR